MTDASDGYLSRNKPHLARLQRKRRARMVRIDYMPSREALAALDAKRATVRAGSVDATNSAVIDAIVAEWAELTGTKNHEVAPPKSPAESPEFATKYAQARMTSDAERSARAQESGVSASIAHAYETGWQSAYLARAKSTARVVCGAKRHRDGQPCEAKSEPGKRRCRFHGGRSTGPKTPEGKARALANLRQIRNAD